MTGEPVDLSRAGRGRVARHRSRAVEAIWLLVEAAVVSNPLQVSSRLRVAALRGFGASIGAGVVFRPRTRVKCPWLLTIGDRCWIGEEVWIHNQDTVTIGADCVISQRTFITTGSHDLATMDLVTAPVEIGSGAWVTATCTVLRGARIGRNAVVTPGSVVRGEVPPSSLYGGNPARLIGTRPA